MKKGLLIGLGAIVLCIGGFATYYNSDIAINNFLQTRIDRPVDVKETTFDINSEYKDGKLTAKVRSFSLNGESYASLQYLLDEDNYILKVLYVDKDDFPIVTIPFYKNELLINDNELIGLKKMKVSKETARNIADCNVYAKIFILRGE